MTSNQQKRIDNVQRILDQRNLRTWSRKFWTETLQTLSSQSELVTRSTGQPHLWSATGQFRTTTQGDDNGKRTLRR
jgi:hypothetical protein